MADLRRWSQLLALAGTEQEQQPERICRLCVEMLDISGAGISMVTTSGNRGVVCATDERAAAIEDLQLTTGVGPCIDAVQSGGPVFIPDLEEPDDVDLSRWSPFDLELRASGVAALFAFPLRIGAIAVGALDLYRERPGDLSAPELAAALLAADAAALALLYVDTDSADAFTPDSETRADYRLHIHQASGMVAVQLGISVQEALLQLRARAYATQRSLSDIAADVVARRVRFSPEDQ